MNLPKTGVPDGSQEQTKHARVKPVTVRGESGPMNAAPDYAETMVEKGREPMADSLRKGRFGNPISAKGPTTMPEAEEFVPDASTEGVTEKFGLARGKFGVNDER